MRPRYEAYKRVARNNLQHIEKPGNPLVVNPEPENVGTTGI